MNTPAITTRPDLRKEFLLAENVRACAIEGQVILLDLHRSRYMAVPEAGALSFAIEGWPACTDTRTRSVRSSSLDIAQSLLARGLLVKHGQRPPVPPVPITPSRSVDAGEHGRVRTPVISTARLVTAALGTAIQLRHRSLAQITASILARRRHFRGAPVQADLQGVAATYARLRPLVMTSRDQCLADSLTLLRFLSYWRLDATWLIGVRARPFAAHSWLQVGDTVLNDRHERVQRYQPILVV